MSDFNAGRDINVGGDVHISEQTNQSRLLVDCTNEELYIEQRYRKKLLSGERKRKVKRCAVILYRTHPARCMK
jgi:hypothetical protein